MDWNEQLQAIADNIRQALLEVNDLEGLEQMRMQILGKKGELTLILRGLGNLDPAERPLVGAKVNELRRKFESVLDERKRHFGNLEQDERLLEERIDVTEPGVSMPRGTLHPLTKTLYEMRDIFIGMGFEVKEGPEIELAEYNFDMLNFKPNHPARDMQDTFYINEDVVLRTHTSPVQVRTMLNEKPPIRMICPGRVFRSDEVDATHSPIFNQMEGLVIDKGVTLADLFGTFDVFAKEMYGSKTETRQRPSYFPFTEPSMELDISCTVCGGKGCRVCKDTGWIELGGSGMVHPNVLRMAGIDPEIYSGFAFGWGIDRVANMKYGITDIRLLYENDIRFLEQF